MIINYSDKVSNIIDNEYYRLLTEKRGKYPSNVLPSSFINLLDDWKITCNRVIRNEIMMRYFI